MGVKLMTGATGEQNIQAADDRECLAGITGLDSYVFPTGSQLKAALVDANTVTIGTGAGSLQGSRFRCSTTTTVNIQSGTQGQYRRDIIGLHFSRETSGREGLEFQVLTGEPAASEGAAMDPAYTAGDLLKGDAGAFMPLYRVKLSGINASDPEPMFSVLTPLATLGDSVSYSTIGVWNVVRVGKAVICTRRERQAIFQGGNEYIRFWTGDFPFEFTEPPTVAVTFVHGDSTTLGVTPSIKMYEVGKSNFVATIYTHTGSLPSQVKLGFDVIAVGVQG